ncbi:hypothetical protein [Neisseria dentiae]|uniref:hypothetical protein n=1 Tax=Neisseria dentiae TaxID=194197 RepID=UPI0035A031D0
MTKKIFAIAVSLALSAPAFADPGFYIQGDAGVSKLKTKHDDGDSFSKSGFSPRFTVATISATTGAAVWIIPTIKPSNMVVPSQTAIPMKAAKPNFKASAFLPSTISR